LLYFNDLIIYNKLFLIKYNLRVKNKMIGITEMYRQANRIFSHGIEGYQIEKKYEKPERILKDRNTKESKVSDVKKIEANR